MSALHEPVLSWYDAHARDLPWREPSASPWAVLVSEFMLQQTPVGRVLPIYEQWLDTWPSPADLAAASPGDAVRAWGRLGYPRRALRLHQAATAIVVHHDGQVPRSLAELRALPGIGDYTAAAVASFAFGQRHVVLDINVCRVLARALTGVEFPRQTPTKSEQGIAADLLPDDPPTAATWAVAVMELGATVCTSASPKCARCPIAGDCSWRRTGYPAQDGPPRRGQSYAGTDRQCRGRLLGLLRESTTPVPKDTLNAVWKPQEQRDRCLASLVDDGLAIALPGDSYSLP